jgi:hypothetical protein
MTPIRPRWSSASFLFYAGAFVALLGGLGLIAALVFKADGHRAAAAAGWSALLAVVAVAAAEALRRRRHDLLAGLAAFLAVVFVTVCAAALVDWVGLAPDATGRFLQRSFEPGLYLVEAVTVVAGLAALARFRFPLLVLPVASTLLLALVDIGTTIVGADTGTGAATVFAAIGGGLLVLTGIALDRTDRRPYGFWLHVVGGIAIGEVLLYLSDRGELGWVVVALGSVVYVIAARVLARSSYAVLGAIGVMVVATHWIGKWLGTVAVPLPFFGAKGGGGDRPEPWQVSLSYVAVGVVLVLLGRLALREEADDVPPVVIERDGDVPPEPPERLELDDA